MSNLSLNNSSPFDSIRRIDENNQEFWSARELMPLLGYSKWQRFEDAIERAKISCEKAGHSVDAHFRHLPGAVSAKGRFGDNYELSRYSCYLVAMNGDPRKEAIANAQSYFAVKAREAEVIVPQQSEAIRQLELQNEVLTKQLQLRQLDHTMLTLHGKETVLALRGMADQIVETEKPTIEIIDERHNVRFKGQTLVQIKEFAAKKYGIKFKSGAEIKRFLEKKKCGDLIAQTPRTQLCEYVPEENLNAVYKILCNDSRQLLIGE
jgi:hypothetical protein